MAGRMAAHVETLTGGTVGRCADCGQPWQATDTAGTLFVCGTPGHDPLALVDVYTEHNETATVRKGLLVVVEDDEHEHECRDCGAPIVCCMTTADCDWQGGNDGCECAL
jgi:hypothetical protein